VADSVDSAPGPIAEAETDGSPFGPNPRAAIAVTAQPIGASPSPAQDAGPDLAAAYDAAVRAIEAQEPGAVEGLKKTANLGYAPAQLYLASLYENGRVGVKKDLAEARRWTERAAQGGDRTAMHNLALYAFEGVGGQPKNAPLAAQWFRRAADLGLVDSQYNLGRLYEQGLGVNQNPAEAYKWYLVAARSGDGESRQSAERVRAKLSADAQGVAQRAAAGYRSAATTAAAASSPSGVIAQRALSRLGYYQGPRDGAASPALNMAIAAYQREQGLPATGALDDTTVAKLVVFTH
jgi:localization factor PodJL